MRKEISGHYTALLTELIWGTTFISTKILLPSFLPIEILFFRFLLGYFALWIISPHRLKVKNREEEKYFALAGLTGACLYYLLENVALTYTLATNVAIIVSVAPFFTAVLSHIFSKEKEKISLFFYLGFLIAFLGILLINLNGNRMNLNPKGDVLALTAALIWAIYSLLCRKINAYGYNVVQSTRRTFFYGLLFMIPIFIFSGASFDLSGFRSIKNLLNIVFLGLGASAMSFVTWNYSVRKLGAIKTSVYIYLIPVVTIVFSFIFLSEPITPMIVIGTLLTLAGLFISEKK